MKQLKEKVAQWHAHAWIKKIATKGYVTKTTGLAILHSIDAEIIKKVHILICR